MSRHLLLNGFMATGKSTVGKALAAASGREFIDLDAAIERRAGSSIQEIFETDGEAAFRHLEREALTEALAQDPAVIAVGGGALVERQTRLSALARATIVCLTASPSTIVERATAQGGRPLLKGQDRLQTVARLMEQREAGYREAHACVNVDGKSPDQVLNEVRRIWQEDRIAVADGLQSYAVTVTASQGLDRIVEHVEAASSVMLISDTNVAPLHAAAVTSRLGSEARCESLIFPAGERQKTPQTLLRIWEQMLAAEADRHAWVVGLGGGVATDIAGFAAATFMRGVPWISLPTSLLGMVDASVGGKTAVDLGSAKNAVGAFWQPSAVVCNIDFLRTEPRRGFVSALAEVVKTALIGDADLFRKLEAEPDAVLQLDADALRDVVRSCIAVKARVVSRDPREGGDRALLNLGHTVGHALEAHAGFESLTHGEAVSLGLVAALRLGVRFGVTDTSVVDRTTALLARLGLPTDLGAFALDEVAPLIGHDKKRRGDNVQFVFARDIGSVIRQPLPLADVTDAVQTLAS